jgi:hypothetical protein
MIGHGKQSIEYLVGVVIARERNQVLAQDIESIYINAPLHRRSGGRRGADA